MRPRPLIALPPGLLVGVLACAPEPAPVLVSDIEPGLRLLGSDRATPFDHLAEIVVHEGYVYAANSGFAVSTFRLDADGGVTLTDPGVDLEDFIRCTTVAVHPPSNTLFCGADEAPLDEPVLEIYDLANPASPTMLDPLPIPFEGVRDIDVVGDTLLLSAFDEGLWQASIAADGNLGPFALTGATADGDNVRFTAALGSRVIVALTDLTGSGTQLRVYDDPIGTGTWTEIDRLELEGPTQGLSVDEANNRVAVALGTMGMAILDLRDDHLSLQRIIQPPAVVTRGLLDGDLAIAVTLSGAFAYSLGDDPGQEHLFGFAPESLPSPTRDGNMLHAVLHDGELITSDWTRIERWAIAPSGEAVGLDVPRGLYLP
ncbi:MAG: hypothetical protein KC457_29665, partial [Myxococcales bacterium]|nr:hypothetical protein [Myxococcales bacterium]